jgi:hypothetical protein
VAQEEEVVGVGAGLVLSAQVVGDGTASGHSFRREGSATIGNKGLATTSLD